jgi:hypothetical protein
MARKYLVSVDLNKNELQNARIQNLGSAPSSPVAGQIYFNTSDHFLYFYSGSEWLRASGDFGAGGLTTDLTFGNTASDGTSTSVARADHTHSIPDVLGTSGQINVAKASVSGDATISLIDSGATAGTYGASDKTLTATVDSKGRITAISESAISIATSQVNDLQEYIEDKVGNLVVAGEGIDVTYDDASGHFTIDAEIATDTNRGVASFDPTDFTVTSGNVVLNAERVQDIVGGMVTSPNTESGISVTYDDVNGKLDFDTNDFTITLTGDVTGSGTVTDLGNVSFATTIQPNSVALGTDTTGDYVAGISGTANEIVVTNSGGEGSSVTIGLPDDVTIGGHLTVNGNLDVIGSINSINSTQVNISDNKINLNSDMDEQATPILDAGIIVHRGIENDALLTWNETADQWQIGLDTGPQHAIARKYSALIGDGSLTSYPVTHNLNTRDVTVEVYDVANYATVETDIVRTSENVVTISFAVAPSAGSYKVVIVG